VLDAPQIANATGQADKIVAIAPNHSTVSYRETDGCYDNESVHYAAASAACRGHGRRAGIRRAAFPAPELIGSRPPAASTVRRRRGKVPDSR